MEGQIDTSTEGNHWSASLLWSLHHDCYVAEMYFVIERHQWNQRKRPYSLQHSYDTILTTLA